jgi:hypothetical protein
MPAKQPDDWQIVSVRLPRGLIQRLDRYLDRIGFSFFRLLIPRCCEGPDERRSL